MESAYNEEEGNDQMSNHLPELIARRDHQQCDIIAEQQVIMTMLEKIKMKAEESVLPAFFLTEELHEKMFLMDKDNECLETLEHAGKQILDKIYADHLEKQENLVRLHKEALSKRIIQLNDAKDKLRDLKNDLKQRKKEKMDLEVINHAIKAERDHKRDVKKRVSATTLRKEIAEREAEYRVLEIELMKLGKNIQSESLKIQQLQEMDNSIAEKMAAKEAEYRKNTSELERINAACSDHKAEYQLEYKRNKKIGLKVESIEEERAVVIGNLNLEINQHQDMNAKLQRDYDKITEKIKSEFGDVQSAELMILEAKATLAKQTINCQTIDSKFNAERQKKDEIEKDKLILLTKNAELNRKFGQKMSEKLLVPTKNLNDPGSIAVSSLASSLHNDVTTEHEFAQPTGIPKRNMRKKLKPRSRRPQQAASRIGLRTINSSLTQSSQISPNNDMKMSTLSHNISTEVPKKVASEEIIFNAADSSSLETTDPEAAMGAHTFRVWRALDLLRELDASGSS